MKIAVTGASGHVGNVLCRELAARGQQFKALVHINSDDLENMGAEVVKGDLLDQGSLVTLFRNAEVVFHLAARISLNERRNKELMKVNVEGTANVIDACLKTGVKRLVYFSSIHALDPFPYDEELNEKRGYNLHSTMSYEASKIMGEKLALSAIKPGLEVVVITPTAIIGPWDFQPSFLGRALIMIHNNSLPMLLPYGYNWVDVRDVVNGALAAAEKGHNGERYILSGHWLSLGDLSAMIGKITGRKTTKFIGSPALAYIGLPFIQAWALLRNEAPLYTKNSLEILRQSNNNISCAKAVSELGYAPRPLEATIKDTFDWFRTHGLIR